MKAVIWTLGAQWFAKPCQIHHWHHHQIWDFHVWTGFSYPQWDELLSEGASLLHETSILLDVYEILEPRWYTVFLIFRVNNTLLVHCSEREVQHWVAKTWILDGSFSSFLHFIGDWLFWAHLLVILEEITFS